MSESEQEKSEQATPFKLHQARRKGVVARGHDLGFLAALILLFGFVIITGDAVLSSVAFEFQHTFAVAATADTFDALGFVTLSAFRAAAGPVLLLASILFAGVLFVEFIQTGPVFSTTPLKPDFKKLNPATGLKRIFSVPNLVQFIKTLLKAAAYLTIAIVVIKDEAPRAASAALSANAVRDSMQRAFIHLVAWSLLAAAGFAVLDQVLSRSQFRKKMRMSRRDVHREFKDREGDPRLKRARKRMHADFAKSRRSIEGLKGSDILVVNPTHVAVGLRYASKTMDAPQITCSGLEALALRLRRLAPLYSIPVIEDRTLARALCQYEMGSAIPPHTYERVADHYLALHDKKKAPTHA